MTVYTIGHSTRSIESFIHVLRTHAVENVVDIRTIAKSRHNPQYNRDDLRRSLKSGDIGYIHFPGPGRAAPHDKGIDQYRLAQCILPRLRRLYADAAVSGESGEAHQHRPRKKTVILCAEAVPWRCHRSLVADALLVRGITVLDILGETGVRPHVLTPFAEIHGSKIIYPGTGLIPWTKRD